MKKLITEIKHAGLRELTEKTLEAAPAAFRQAPASTSGKYHHADECAPGGLVLHTRRVYRVALDLLQMYGISESAPMYSVCQAAALLHDCCKVQTLGEHSRFDHPLQAAELVRSIAPQVQQRVPAHLLHDLCGAISAHMGRWSTSTYAPGIKLPRPNTATEWLVHQADYLASRKHINVEL